MLCAIATARIRAWFQAYENLQFLAVLLLYVQVACSLIGSLGVSFTGALVANLAIALFALVAIESGSQALGRTYAVLLVCALLLDIAWFILFSVEIREYRLDSNIGKFAAFSLQLVLGMQIAGFIVRFVSAFLWLQMYRLGSDQGGIYSHIDVEARVVSLGISSSASSSRTTRQSSISDEVLGGSIYNPAYYSSLFSSPDEGHSFKEGICASLVVQRYSQETMDQAYILDLQTEHWSTVSVSMHDRAASKVDGLYKVIHSHGSDPHHHVNKLLTFNHESA